MQQGHHATSRGLAYDPALSGIRPLPVDNPFPFLPDHPHTRAALDGTVSSLLTLILSWNLADR